MFGIIVTVLCVFSMSATANMINIITTVQCDIVLVSGVNTRSMPLNSLPPTCFCLKLHITSAVSLNANRDTTGHARPTYRLQLSNTLHL